MAQHGATLVEPAQPAPLVEAPPAEKAPERQPVPAAVVTKPTPVVVVPPVRKRVLDRRLAMWLGIGCPLVTAINITIEPVPANPDAPVPVAATLLFLIFTVAVVATAMHAARRQATTLPWASLAGALAVVLTVSCPVSGHHTSIGWWWYTQMALSSGFLAFSLVAWRRHRRPAA